MSVIDYTQARKGSKSYHGLPIDYCPKCGRKGERTFHTNPKGQRVEHFVHKGEVVNLAGFALFHITDSCLFIREEEKTS